MYLPSFEFLNAFDVQGIIRFLLCDYRQLPNTFKYDRIISCEAIEHVGHEYYEEFFASCESVLTEDGVFVLQFISVTDGRYDEIRRTLGFVREYIFPGGCLPSLSRLTSAMAASSRLCVEHVEKIGTHYDKTLRCWRANLMSNQSKILALGFDQEFIRTFDYYFDSTAAGFKTETLGDYQLIDIVESLHGGRRKLNGIATSLHRCIYHFSYVIRGYT